MKGRLLYVRSLWVCLLCCFGLACAQADLVVATYNVRNYNTVDRMTEGGYFRAYPKPQVEKTAVRKAISAIDADILCLQEMGPQPYLEELLRDLRNEGIGYPHVAFFKGGDPDRHLAILSRRPIKEVFEVTDLSFRYFGNKEQPRRGLLGVEVEHEGEPLFIYTLHLSSRFTYREDDPSSNIRREGEARTIRDYLRKRHGDPIVGRILVGGDFNDERDSPTLARFMSIGSRTLLEMMEAKDRNGHRWTHHYGRKDLYTRVDYILTSPSLSPLVTDSVIYDGEEVGSGSDHRPVYIRLKASSAEGL